MKTLVVLISLFVICSCSSKQWKLDVNFNNPKNWDSGKTPCATNRIIFPETVNVMLLQTNLSSVKEFVLPMNGQIILPPDMILPFSDDASADPSCDGQDINFIRTSPESWFNPNNWQDMDNLVSVETERVPCQYDNVIFPDMPYDKVFSVALDTSVAIGKMSFSGKDYTDSLFSSFLASESGKSQFATSDGVTVQIQERACPTTSGCPCGNDNPDMLTKICNLYTCLAVSCNEAVTPVGGCCPLCGAILTMGYDPATFDMGSFTTKIHNEYHVHDSAATSNRKRREVDTGEVDTYTSKTNKDMIQLVLTDKAVGSSSGQTAIKTADAIMADMQRDPESFGITSVTGQSSSKGTGAQTDKLSGGGVAGIVVAALIVVVIFATLGFMFMRNRATFFSKDAPLHADMDIPQAFMEEVPGEAPAMFMQSFENPVYAAPNTRDNLYDNPLKAVSLAPDVASKGKKGKGSPPEDIGIAGFDNPSYASGSFNMGLDSAAGIAPSSGAADEHDGIKEFPNIAYDMSKDESES